jgi:hypothetical protein
MKASKALEVHLLIVTAGLEALSPKAFLYFEK